jgi:hypothetical protein
VRFRTDLCVRCPRSPARKVPCKVPLQ